MKDNFFQPLSNQYVLSRDYHHPIRYAGLAIIFLITSIILFVLIIVEYWAQHNMTFVQSSAVISFLISFSLFYMTCRTYKKQYRDKSILTEIFEGSPSARLVTDIQCKAIFFNPVFEDMCSDEKKPSLNIIREIFARKECSETTERLESLILNAMHGHEDVMETQTLSASNETIWYRLSAQPVAGWIGCVHWRIDDVTERRSVDMVIREDREKLVDFTDHAPVGFYSMDENGRFTFVNATLARWLGSDIDGLLNGGLLHAYIDSGMKNIKPYDISKNGGARQVVEVNMKGPMGRVFSASINQSVVIEDENKIRVRGVVHDLTSEREMRQALKDSEDRFRRFFDEAPLGIAMLGFDKNIIDSNIMLSTMLKLKADKIYDADFLDFVADEDKENVKNLISDVRHKNITTDPVDVELISPNEDEPIAVKMYAGPLKGGIVAIRVFDRSEQKSLEAQVNQSQKMQAVGQLAGGVAHDFNNLLTAIIGFCDLLLLRHKAGDPSFNDLMQIKQNSNRASNLVRQLLAFSRQQQLTPKVLDVTETLTELSHLIRRLIGAQIDFDMVHAQNLYDIKVDEGQLEQVLINLAVNARDAMDGKGSLEIKTENLILETSKPVMNDMMHAGEWVAIHVTDTGSGIDRKTLDRIFEPFFTTKKIGEGTGLGLATVYGIIRQTGGYIDVDTVIGEGTTFSVYLPRHIDTGDKKDVIVEVKKQEIKNEDLTGTATVLLVEDEDAVRMFSSRALSNKGYKVLEADCGESGLGVVNDYDGVIDLIITDVIMPEMDGPTMAKEIIKEYPDMPIIFVSGYTEDRFKEEIGDNAHFLPKPFSLQQLATKVKEVLSKK